MTSAAPTRCFSSAQTWSGESSKIACVASSRRPSTWKSRTHCSAFWIAHSRDDAVEGPLLAERPDVQLVEHEAVQRDTVPGVVAPLEGGGVEDARRSGRPLRLPARARVGPCLPVDDEEIVVSGEAAEPA